MSTHRLYREKTMEITVGELKCMLDAYNDNDVLSFSGLEFNRLKRRGPKVVQVEFYPHVYKERDSGKVVIECVD